MPRFFSYSSAQAQAHAAGPVEYNVPHMYLAHSESTCSVTLVIRFFEIAQPSSKRLKNHCGRSEIAFSPNGHVRPVYMLFDGIRCQISFRFLFLHFNVYCFISVFMCPVIHVQNNKSNPNNNKIKYNKMKYICQFIVNQFNGIELS